MKLRVHVSGSSSFVLRAVLASKTRQPFLNGRNRTTTSPDRLHLAKNTHNGHTARISPRRLCRQGAKSGPRRCQSGLRNARCASHCYEYLIRLIIVKFGGLRKKTAWMCSFVTSSFPVLIQTSSDNTSGPSKGTMYFCPHFAPWRI